MSAPVIIYDTNLDKMAYLPLAFNVGYHLRANEVGRAWFSVPFDDPHLSEIQELRYAEIFNGDTRVELFRILKSWKEQKSGKESVRFECEHVLGTLMDDEFDDTFYEGAAGTTDAITDILAEQGTGNWQIGTCAFAESYLYEWKRGTSLLKALLDVPKRFQEGYFWTFDTSSYPWTISLIVPPTTVTAYIDYGRNMESIQRKKDVTGLVTKLYPHGAKAGTDQIDITSEEPSSNAYITNNTAIYGTIVHHWTDQRYTTAVELYAAAQEYLIEISEPSYTYRIDAADVYRLTGESIDLFTIGALAKVDNPEIEITTEVRVMEIKKSDVTGKPGNLALTFANKGQEFDLSPKLSVNDLSNVSITDIPGGVPGQLPSVPDGAGLYITTDYLGYHTGVAWATYMDSTGKLWAQHDDAHFQFDPVAGTLDIKVTAINLDGTVDIIGTTQIKDLAVTNAKINDLTVTKLTAGNLTVEMNLTTGGTLKSDNYVFESSGWKIDHDGNARFNNATVRGTLNATDIVAGTLNFTGGMGRANLLVENNEIKADSVRTDQIKIDGNLTFYGMNSIIGIDRIFRSTTAALTQPWIQLANTALTLNSGSTVGNDVTLTATDKIYIIASGDLTLSANGDGFNIISAKVVDSKRFVIGHEGYIECFIGGVTRYLAFREEV